MTVPTNELADDFADFHNAAGEAIDAAFRVALGLVEQLAAGVIHGCAWLREQTAPKQLKLRPY